MSFRMDEKKLDRWRWHLIDCQVTSSCLSLSLSLSGRVTRFAKFGKSLQVFVKTSCQLISYLSNCWAYFGKMQHYWANWNCSKWPNIEKKSNHLVTLLSDNRARRPKTSDQLTFSVDPFLIDTLLPILDSF